MSPRKLLAGVAVIAAVGAGAAAGAVLGVPSLSSAQTPGPSAPPTAGPGHHGPFGGFGHQGPLRRGASLGIVAKDLSMGAPDVKKALEGGQSIAALAKSRNVDPQKIVNDLVADATARVDKAASSGRITPDRAARIKARLTARITAFVNGTWEPELGHKLGGRPSLGIVAKDLSMGVPDVKKALQGGQSIAALAKSRNVDPQKIVNDLVADATARVDKAASSGRITPDQAAKIKARLTEGITAFVNGTGATFGFPGPSHGLDGQEKVPTATATPGGI